MPYDARGLADQARSLADLENTKNITNADENNLINEAWRELYARYLNSGGDYFITEYIFTLQAPWQDQNVPAGTDWLVPLPADFDKIRYLDWFTGGQWMPVDSFSMSQRDWMGGTPRYRIKNSTLWLVVPPGVGTQFRLGYYPPPAVISVPDTVLSYGAAIADYNKSLVTSPTWSPSGETMVYVYNSNQIIAESTDNGTVSTLLTAAGTVTWLRWYKGYLYWIQAGNILRAPTDLVTLPLSPVTVVNTGNVTSLSVWGDALYWSDGTNTRKAALDGSGAAIVLTAPSFGYHSTPGGFAYLAASPGNVQIGTAVLAFNVAALVGDGTYLFTLDTSGVLRKLTVSVAAAVTDATILASNIAALGPHGITRLPVIVKTNGALQAISDQIDTVFSFPNSEVNEIMAYMAAVAFARKSGDQERMALLKDALGTPEPPAGPSGLWARFYKTVQRDEYQAQRVTDGYGGGMPGPWGWGW